MKPRCIRTAMHHGWTALLVVGHIWRAVSRNMFAPRALPAARLTGLGATRGFTTGSLGLRYTRVSAWRLETSPWHSTCELTFSPDKKYSEFEKRYPALGLIGNTRMVEITCFREEFPGVRILAKDDRNSPIPAEVSRIARSGE